MGMQEFNKTIIDEFRANAGAVGGQFAGAPLLLLKPTKTGLILKVEKPDFISGKK